jgi:hypothetical protein
MAHYRLRDWQGSAELLENLTRYGVAKAKACKAIFPVDKYSRRRMGLCGFVLQMIIILN